jgi:hypothetical protein
MILVASGCVTCIVRLYNEKGEECFDRRVSATTKAMPMQECIPKNYTLVSEDQLFMLKQYITEQMFREKVYLQDKPKNRTFAFCENFSKNFFELTFKHVKK